MDTSWPFVRLEEVAPLVRRPVEIDPNKEYPELGVRSFGRGIFHKGVLKGVDLTWQKLFRVEAGDLIFSNIKACEGAFAIARPEDHGRVGSHRYLTCVPKEGVCEGLFLWYYLQTPGGLEQVQAASPGSADRNRTLSQEGLAAIKVPLPPIAQQRQFVARVERVARLVEEHRRTRAATRTELDAACAGAFARIIKDVQRRPMAQVAPLVRRPVEVNPDGSYPELAVRSFGRGVFHKGTLRGSELTWQKLFRVESGDLVFSNIKAWEGAFAVAGPEDHGRVGSHRYLTCVPRGGVAEAFFVWYYLQTPDGLEQVQAASPGSADRNRTLSQERLMQAEVPVPAIEKQRQFVELLRRATDARRMMIAADADLDALLPTVLRQAFAAALEGTDPVALARGRPAA